MPCKTVETYPLFFRRISCPTPIMGESSRSRRSLNLAKMAFACVIPIPRTISRQKIVIGSDSRSGLILGQFLESDLFFEWASTLLSSGKGLEAGRCFSFAERAGLLDDYVVDVEVSLHE